MANTHEVLAGVKDYTLDLLGVRFRDAAIDAASRAESQAGVATGHAEQSGEDRRQTGEDRTQTGEDRRQTGEDRTQTGKDAEAAEGWASQSKDAATLAITAAATTSQYVGDGFPEGKVSAPVGSIYVDRQATAGAIRWIKTQGTGNTGWQVGWGDTGWRDVRHWSDGLLSFDLTGGEMKVRREGGQVTIIIRGLGLPGVNSPHLTTNIPTGFRPYPRYSSLGTAVKAGALLSVENTGWVDRITLGGTARRVGDGEGVYATIIYPVDDPWPTTLPGTPA